MENVKRLVLFLACAAALSAQSYTAADYAYGTSPSVPALAVTAGNVAPGAARVTLSYGVISLANGQRFAPLSTNAPIIIGNGANAETVTPSSITCPTPSAYGTCSFVATFANIHGNGDTVRSATFGLQEAINAASAGSAGAVIITASWLALGGTSGIITAATLPANVSLFDISASDGSVKIGRGAAALQIAQNGNLTVPSCTGCGGGSGTSTPWVQTSLGTISGAVTLNLASGNQIFTGTLGGNVTLTVIGAGDASFELDFVQDAIGGRMVTYDASFSAGGTFDPTASQRCMQTFNWEGTAGLARPANAMTCLNSTPGIVIPGSPPYYLGLPSASPTNGDCAKWQTIGGIITLTDAGSGCGGSGFNPFDNSTVSLVENFCSGGSSSSNVNTGALGWTFAVLGTGTPTVGVAATLDANHICGIKLAGPATTSNGAYMTLLPGSGVGFPSVMWASATFRATTYEVQFRLSSTSNIRMEIGFGQRYNSLAPAGMVGCYLRYDTTLSDTGYMALCSNGGGGTPTSVAGTVDTTPHRLRFTTTSAGTFSFSIDGGTATTISQSISAGTAMAPYIHISNDGTSTTSSIDVYKVAIQVQNLSVN